MGAANSSVPQSAPVNPDTTLVRYNLPKGQHYFTSDATGEMPILSAAKGPSSFEVCKPMTLHEVFANAVKRHGDKTALGYEGDFPLLDGGKTVPPPLPREQWKKWNYKQYYAECRNAAKGFIKLGYAMFDSVTVFGYNSPEWFMSQWSSQFAGGKVSGVYPSDTAVQVQYKALISDSSIITLDGKKELEAVAQVISDLPYVKAVVCWGYDNKGANLTRADGSSVPVLTWKQLIALGAKEKEDALNARIAATRPGHCCALVFTSGTTGNPKATMISHDAIICNCVTILKNGVPHIGELNQGERGMSYLPLSHIAGMMVDICFPMVFTSMQPGWGEAYFARPYDLKVGSLGARLQTVQPTLFLGVPRVWEKIAEKLQAVGAANGAAMQKVGNFAKSRGLEYNANRQVGGSGETPFGMLLANKIGSKIKEALGLQYCHFALSGAAPLAYETQAYFASLGINIYETYGMSESTGATTWSNATAYQWGTVGFCLPGHEVRIFKIDDKGNKKECPPAKDIKKPTEEEQGEVCFRGRHIMMGYMANPKLGKEHLDEIHKKNAEAIDEDGWMHSGDKGCKSVQGMVRITGRYKELIKGAGGENIAPVPIEDDIKKRCPAISNVMMVGDKRKFNICFVTLKAIGATGELPGGNELDPAAIPFCSSGITTISAAMGDKKLIKTIADAIKATNENGKVCPSPAAMVQKFTILPRDFSVETGELTATMKLKRSVAEEKHIKFIDAIYEQIPNDSYVPYKGVQLPAKL